MTSYILPLLLFLLTQLSSFQPFTPYKNYYYKYPYTSSPKRISRLYLTNRDNNKNINNFNKCPIDNFHYKRPDYNDDNNNNDIQEQQLINTEISTLLKDIQGVTNIQSFQKDQNQQKKYKQHDHSDTNNNVITKDTSIKNILLKTSTPASFIGLLSFMLILKYIFKVLIMGIKMGCRVGLVGFGVVAVKKLVESLGGDGEDNK